MATYDKLVKVLGNPDTTKQQRGYDYFTWVLKDGSYVKYMGGNTRIDYYAGNDEWINSFPTPNLLKNYIEQSNLTRTPSEEEKRVKRIDFIKKLEQKLEELTPKKDNSVGFDERSNNTTMYPDRFELKGNKLDISYYYETVKGHSLDENLEKRIVKEVSDLVGIEPKTSDVTFMMGRPDSNGKYERVGIIVKLTYDLTMVGRVQSKGFRTLLGLK